MKIDATLKKILLLLLLVLSGFYVTKIIDWMHGTLKKITKWYHDKKEDKLPKTIKELELMKQVIEDEIYDRTAVTVEGKLPDFDDFSNSDDFGNSEGFGNSDGFSSSDGFCSSDGCDCSDGFCSSDGFGCPNSDDSSPFC